MCETGKDAECEAEEVGGFKVVQAGTRRDLFHPITFFSLSLSLSLSFSPFLWLRLKGVSFEMEGQKSYDVRKLQFFVASLFFVQWPNSEVFIL